MFFNNLLMPSTGNVALPAKQYYIVLGLCSGFYVRKYAYIILVLYKDSFRTYIILVQLFD